MIRATISLKEVPSKCIDFWWYLHHSVCGGVEASLPLLNSFEGWKWVGTAVAVRKPSVIPPTTASVTLCVQKRAYCKVIEELPYPNLWMYKIYEMLDAVSVTSHHLTSQLFSLAGQLILKRRGASMSLTEDGEREGRLILCRVVDQMKNSDQWCKVDCKSCEDEAGVCHNRQPMALQPQPLPPAPCLPWARMVSGIM